MDHAPEEQDLPGVGDPTPAGLPRRLADAPPPPSSMRRRTVLTALLAGASGALGGWFGRDLMSVRIQEVQPTPSHSATVPQSDGLLLETGRGWVSVAHVAAGVARIRIGEKEGERGSFSYAVDRELPGQQAVQMVEDGNVAFGTDQLMVIVDKATGALSARNSTGTEFITETGVGYRKTAKGVQWQVKLPAGETCNGFGQRSFTRTLRGLVLKLWNYDAGSYLPEADPLYMNVPFYLGHRGDVSYGIFWDNPSRGAVDLGSHGKGTLTFSAERGSFCIYIVAGDNPQQVVERYAQLTGLMELPPLWALGYHQSRWGYRTADDFLRIARRFRKERIPCDALHFDIDYMEGFRVFTWARSRFKDPAGLLAKLKAQGFGAVAIVDPGVKVDQSYSVFRSGVQRKVFLSDNGKPALGEVWPGVCQFPDFTKPDARAWWSDQVAQFVKVGLSGIWNDMNEPSVFNVASRTLPDAVTHDWEGEGNTHVGGGHAVYGMQMARATREGVAAAMPDKRPFVITRAGYAGVQRYATTWNGDSRSSWEHLRMSIPQICNLGICGVPFSGTDAGGFRGEPDAELYLRWMQFASMTPFFRTHSARTATDRAPWTYDAATTSAIRMTIEQRYRLLPYLYTQVRAAATVGTPIVRPMFFEAPGDGALAEVEDQFMAGGALLVAPIVHKGAVSRTVRLPAGSWYRLGTSSALQGDRLAKINAGMGLPILVRAGSVIPSWPVRQSTSEPVDQADLDLYAGTGSSTLYEDAGDGFGYKDDEYLLSTFAAGLTGDTMTLDVRTEGNRTQPTNRNVIVHGLQGTPTSVTCDGKPVSFRASAGKVTLNVPNFQHLEIVR